MFAHDSVDVTCPFDTVAARLRSPGWLRPIWEATAERLSSHTMLGDGLTFSGNVCGGFEIGQPRTRATSLLLPVSWEVYSPLGLAAGLEGDLEATPVHDLFTRLQLNVFYTPPESVQATDFHRIAAASVGEVLAGVAASLAGGGPQ